MVKRFLEKNINDDLFKGKTIIIYGARQVGKTTLVQNLLKDFGDKGRYLNCEIINVEENLKEADPEKLKAFLGNYGLVVLDEAQNIPNIGKILKIMTDNLKETLVIATGSSSFDLANKTAEPMTGRIYRHILYPLSILELKDYEDWLEIDSKLERFLIYGSYPEIYNSNNEEASNKLIEISSSYLFKDVLKFEGIKKSRLLKDLVLSLALQLGNEVTYNELASGLGVSSLTVQKYIDLLEQSFVIYRLNAFSKNIRNEISKSFKVYFYDNGIRNAIINNFNKTSLRNDVGALWENFCISERMKSNSHYKKNVKTFFWRTYDQKEIDFIEQSADKLTGYEFKYSAQKKFKPSKTFTENYNADVHLVNRRNYWKFTEIKI